jgi:hypothetical protein
MKKNYLLFYAILIFSLTISSCKKEDSSSIKSSNSKIIGKWVNASGKKTDMSYISCTRIPLGIITWEFTSDGFLYTNDDAVCSSTFEFNNSTNELKLWGGVQKVTVKWISATEIEANIIGRLKKQ